MLKILKDFDKGERATQDETRKLNACTLKEINDAIRKDGIETYRSALPVFTRTNLEYTAGATKALIWNEGDRKKTKIKLPLKDGWYLCDKKWGIPNGAPSNESNPNALYFWRWQNRDFSGLLTRCFYRWNDRDWRSVDANYRPNYRFGVIESARKIRRLRPNKEKHTHKFVCACGAVKGENK
jgi:hypothetical protein